MNWKEYARLFANGEFKYRCNHHAEEGLPFTDWNYAMRKFINEDVYDFKLIARPISSMTDEEFQKTQTYLNAIEFIEEFADGDEYELTAEWLCGTEFVSADDFLYLLSIGVFPFDQKAFETGEVLNKEEL